MSSGAIAIASTDINERSHKRAKKCEEEIAKLALTGSSLITADQNTVSENEIVLTSSQAGMMSKSSGGFDPRPGG